MRLRQISLFALLALGSLRAQDGHGVTPAQIERGGQLFLANCSRCHGQDGTGVAGVDLGSGRFRRARNDADLSDIVRKGIPNTPMPPSSLTEEQAVSVVAWLHSLASAPRVVRVGSATGDANRGKAIFEGKGQCLTCHRLGEQGGFTGPDLSSIGSQRATADIERKLLDPNAKILDANRPIRAVSLDGTVINGTLMNYDNYSLQMLDTNGKLRALQTDKLRGYEILKISPMTSYRDKLSEQEIADTVSYLVTLRGDTR